MKKFLTISVTVFVIAALMSFPSYAANIASVMSNENWINYVEHSINIDKTTGISVAAVKGSDVGFKNWGYANVEDNTLMTEETPVHIGSCSKAFTALAVLLLQEEGKLSIEDSISDYIPWWHVTYKGEDADIKIWQILNHSSGLSYFVTGTRKNADEEGIARIAKDVELVSAPGEKFRYIDFGYCILAYLIETVSGMPYSEYVVKEIMQPIGMTHSGFDLPIAQGHIYFWGSPTEHDDIQPKGNEGAALVCTTPSDMVLWMKAQLGQLELPEKLTNAIAASHERNLSHQPKNDPNSDYFNGWSQSSDKILWHAGQNPNYTARVIIDPVHDIAVFAVCNSAADTSYYAARSCYMLLAGGNTGMFPETDRSNMHKYDLRMAVVSVAVSVLLVFAVIMLITQKKRLAKKPSTSKKEKTLLVVRLVILLPTLCVSAALPYILGALAGFDGFGYDAFWIWGLRSGIIMCLLIDALIVCLIVTSISRFLRYKGIKDRGRSL